MKLRVIQRGGGEFDLQEEVHNIYSIMLTRYWETISTYRLETEAVAEMERRLQERRELVRRREIIRTVAEGEA